MSLYFENPAKFPEPGSISVNSIWHPEVPLLAVASFSQDRGGFVIIFDEQGESLRDVNYPSHRSYQVTALAWHQERVFLVTGWENGELKLWNGKDKEFCNVVGPHKGPITLLEFSEKGGCLASCDSTGSIVGWKVDGKGETNLSFHLELKETITYLTFRKTVKNHLDYDIKGLAKAAVNGDEHALDMFSNWRPKTTARKFRVQEGSDNTSFFVATQAGSVYYINSSGSCAEVLNTEGVPLACVMYHPMKDVLIVMMEGLTIGRFSVDYQGNLTELSKVKLSGRVQSKNIGTQGIVWAGSNTLGVLTGELNVRLWDIDTNDNYVMPTSLKMYTTEEKFHTVNEIFTCIAYCKANQTLCAGTNIGRIYFWTKRKYVDVENLEDLWELNNINTISGTIKQLMWGSLAVRSPLLSVNCVTAVYVMKEQNICYGYSEKIWATQKTANHVLLECDGGESLLELHLPVTDIAVSDKTLVFSNNKTITMYEVSWDGTREGSGTNKEKATDKNNCPFSTKKLSTFNFENDSLLIHNDIVITINSKAVSLVSQKGLLVASIVPSLSEGEPIGMNLTRQYLTVFTMEGHLKIFDVSETQPKLLSPSKTLYDAVSDFGEVIQAKSNSAGNKVAMTVAGANLIPDGRLYVWDVESDELVFYNFKSVGGASEDELEGEIVTVDDDERVKSVYAEVCQNRVPIDFSWDDNDPRLLVCSARKLKGPANLKGFTARTKSNAEKKTLKDEDHILLTIFVSPENKIHIHDVKAADAETQLISCSAPFIVTLQSLSITREVMSDFGGLEKCDAATRDAVLEFSYNLTLGNMDAAFKAIKLVESSGVWGSLARMCVKTKRLDVAGVCLGHIGNAAAARALRLAMADKGLPQEAKVAVLAVHLGLLDEAEQLYAQCGRFDLLNKLQRSRNKMSGAHALAKTKDRINLRNTEHALARSLEKMEDFKEAASRYESANTHLYDVPRMLGDHPLQLQAYMSKTKDKELLKWWGQYIESQGDMSSALKLYASVGDEYSQIRVLCFLGRESVATELARASNDKAVFYHMARYYETIGNFEEAVHYFTKATAYCNAVRLCKENDMIDELWNLSLVVSSRDKIECAKFFEGRGDLEKAVVLYHRGGMLHKVLDLAFRTRQYEVLQEVATELNANSDPALLQKCTKYFIDNEQFDKAVNLLGVAKKYNEAIELCMKHNIVITEDLAEKLTPEKDSVDEESRLRILENLAESLMLQGDFHLATKKFTQAGDKIRAMKALLKSGDTEKVVFYAGVSRQREIYIMAANYLQSLDWQNQPDILHHIITFYSKGKAMDLLANFYVACAQVEIDEFQNYEKAFGALTEAYRCLQKISTPKDPKQVQKAAEIIQQRLAAVKRFLDVRRLFERGDPQAGVAQCRQLLAADVDEPEIAVRRGDVYAMMLQQCVKTGNFAEAKQIFLELRQVLSNAGGTITSYVSKEMLQAVADGLGVPLNHLVPPTQKSVTQSADDNDTVEEELDA